MTLDVASLMLGYATYLIATASPGPANLAIMATSARAGRRAGLRFAAGVISGSFLWGLCAAMGLTSIMVYAPQAFMVVKIVGGLYLLWLAFKSLKIAVGPARNVVETGQEEISRPCLHGFLLHLTNPKAVLGWSSTIAVGVPAGGSSWQIGVMLSGCFVMGVMIFTGYALLFSTFRARHYYQAFSRKIHGALAVVFGGAGVKLLADAG